MAEVVEAEEGANLFETNTVASPWEAWLGMPVFAPWSAERCAAG